MDTKPLEIESESYIKHELLKYNFKVTKPDFDTEGTDLLIVDNIKNKFTHFLRIQCKGRTLKNGSHITIPKGYVEDNFIIFLYIKNEFYDTFLFVFFYEDILKWKTRGDNYILVFDYKKIKTSSFSSYKFSGNKVNEIKAKLKNSTTKKYTTLVIDGIFLDHAIADTVKRYQAIHPTKKFQYPKLNDIVVNILSMYDNFKAESKSINCFVFYTSHLNTPDLSKISNKFSTSTGLIGNLYINITDEFAAFEIFSILERTINTENVILVADDPSYMPILNELMEKDIDITLVMFASNAGGTMYTKHKWGDICYPLAKSIGLKEHEW